MGVARRQKLLASGTAEVKERLPEGEAGRVGNQSRRGLKLQRKLTTERTCWDLLERSLQGSLCPH